MTFCNRRNSKLLPCPLCGTEASVTRPIDGVYNISCGVANDGSDTCGLVLFGSGSKEDRMGRMIEKWNRRSEVVK